MPYKYIWCYCNRVLPQIIIRLCQHFYGEGIFRNDFYMNFQYTPHYKIMRQLSLAAVHTTHMHHMCIFKIFTKSKQNHLTQKISEGRSNRRTENNKTTSYSKVCNTSQGKLPNSIPSATQSLALCHIVAPTSVISVYFSIKCSTTHIQ